MMQSLELTGELASDNWKCIVDPELKVEALPPCYNPKNGRPLALSLFRLLLCLTDEVPADTG